MGGWHGHRELPDRRHHGSPTPRCQPSRTPSSGVRQPVAADGNYRDTRARQVSRRLPGTTANTLASQRLEVIEPSSSPAGHTRAVIPSCHDWGHDLVTSKTPHLPAAATGPAGRADSRNSLPPDGEGLRSINSWSGDDEVGSPRLA